MVIFSPLLRLLFAACCAALVAGSANALQPATADEVEAEIERKELEQMRQLRKLKADLEKYKDSPRYEELKQLAAQIEARMSVPRKLYLTRKSKLTDEMKAYYARLERRIEDCGTRHFPKKDGKSIYGSGAAIVQLDARGRASNVEVVESSGSRQLDSQFVRIVGASSPFGPLPKQLTETQKVRYEYVVIVIPFNFTNDGASRNHPVDESERCKWK